MNDCTHPPEFRTQREIEVGRETRPATREMAMDGGDLALEGYPVDCGPILEITEFCDKCGEQLVTSQ